MANKINKDKSIINECNIRTDILNPTKHTKTKYGHYLPILQGCMNNRSGRALFLNFLFLLYSGNSSKIIMGDLMSKIKPKNPTETMWENQAGKFRTSKQFNYELYMMLVVKPENIVDQISDRCN